MQPAAQIVLGSLESTQLTPQEKKFLAQQQPLGITLFKRNIVQEPGFPQLQQFLQGVHRASAAKLPLLVAIDQEGGRVARLQGDFPNLGAPLHLFEDQPASIQEQRLFLYGERVGHGLSALGIHINFAPVADIFSDHTDPSIGDRCFGTTPQQVILRAGAFLRGLQSTGVWGCLKHFPGQGLATSDTHDDPCTVNQPSQQLLANDIQVFATLLAHCHMVMTSHCLYTNLDREHPASLSPVIIDGMLKKTLSFEGVVVSDDMTMGAMRGDQKEWTERIIAAIEAGTHMVLVCKGIENWQRAIEAITRQCQSSSRFAQKVDQAAEKTRALRQKLQPTPTTPHSSPAHHRELKLL